MLTKDDDRKLPRPARRDGATYSEVEPGFWIVRPAQEKRSLDRRELHAPRRAPSDRRHDAAVGRQQSATLTRRLLELNASDLLTGRTAFRTIASS
jgi:hypothetical protein